VAHRAQVGLNILTDADEDEDDAIVFWRCGLRWTLQRCARPASIEG